MVNMRFPCVASWLALAWILAAQPSALAEKHHHHHGTQSQMMPSVDDSGGVKGEVHGALWKFQEDLKSAFNMPLESQKAFLAIVGAGLTGTGKLKCNIFGGVPSCSDVEALRETCAGVNRKVDCALLSTANSAGGDPKVAMKTAVEKQGLEPCDACLDALHAFWCGQSVPTCGTFDKMVDELLPAIQKVLLGDKRPNQAVSEAVPKLLQAASLGLPCREMCDAITASCGCGKPTTFGKMMTILHQKAPPVGEASHLYATNMSMATAREVFAGVWDRPICQLFALSSMPGFAGTCNKPAATPGACAWCAKNQRPDFIDEQIVAQISQTISGMMQSGLERFFEASDPKQKGSSTLDPSFDWNDQSTSSPSVTHPVKRASSWPWVLMGVAILCLALLMIAAVKIKQHKLHSVPYAHLDIDSGLDGLRYNPPVL